MVMTFYVLSECSVWGLLLDVLRGRDVTILGVWPRIKVMAPLLNRLVTLLTRLPHVNGIKDIPDLPWHERVPGRGGFYNDVHHRAEAELRRRYDLPAHAPLAAENAYPFRKAVTSTVGTLVPIYLTVEWLAENRPLETWSLRGAPPLLLELAEILKAPFPPCKADNAWAATGNVINLLLILLGVTAWVAVRVRPKVQTEQIHLMADEADDFDRALLTRAFAQRSDCMVFDRSLDHREFQGGKFTAPRRCLREDARVSPAVALTLLAHAARDIMALWRFRSRADAGVSTQWAAQIVRRVMFAALFQRFRPKLFWARDDYSTEHVVRAQEVRKLGGRSVGMAHGLPIDTYVHMWREVDFDTYFMFGTDLYRYYRDVWPAGMRIIPSGPFRQPVDMRARIKAAQPRPKDIVFLAMAAAEMQKITDVVRAVAVHFQDRRLFVKMKPGRSDEDNAAFAACMEGAPPNLVVTTENTYELMLKASYALTSGSSTTVEAISFGLKAFVIDVDPTLSNMYYRSFPGLAVPDAQTIIDRIEAMEAGREHYDFEALAELVVLDGPHPLDLISAELGLSVPAQPAMVHACL
jgi:hypothetical protein